MKEYDYHQVPVFAAQEFDSILRETQPDTVIVCTPDATHHEYIVSALRLGCEVVTEKPMATDEQGCRAVMQAVHETGRRVRVAFNVRWTPGATKVRELVQSGVIGNIHAVNMEYQLNTSHGADYFRRWHAHKEYSGGLLVHKSTHHFDLVNWWINAIPHEVFAWGALNFYGRQNALRRGDEHLTRYDRYTGSALAKDDPFRLSLDEHERLRELYLNAEADSGYLRDRNVFRDDISIEDTMSVMVKYRTGAILNYSLIAFSPRAGFRVSLSGDRGRIEYTEMYDTRIISGEDKASTPNAGSEEYQMQLRVYPMFKPGFEVSVREAAGGHGGGDPLLQAQIFDANAPSEILGRNAGHEQGAASALVGAAANHSIASGRPIMINELCPLRPEALYLNELA
jgi:predicted dehydrogenase